jgi:hypothetical protein
MPSPHTELKEVEDNPEVPTMDQKPASVVKVVNKVTGAKVVDVDGIHALNVLPLEKIAQTVGCQIISRGSVNKEEMRAETAP